MMGGRVRQIETALVARGGVATGNPQTEPIRPKGIVNSELTPYVGCNTAVPSGSFGYKGRPSSFYGLSRASALQQTLS